MSRERRYSLFGNEAEEEIFPLREVWRAKSDTRNLEEQIGTIFEALRMPVYHYLLSVFGDPAEAEDLTQDAFLQLYKGLVKGQEINNVRFWIFRTAHNLAINKRKHQQFVSALQFDSWDEVEKLIPDHGPNPEQIMLRSEQFQQLYNGLSRLTLSERQALYLRSEGFRYKEIAEIMNIGVPTVGEYLRRSIRKLGGNRGE